MKNFETINKLLTSFEGHLWFKIYISHATAALELMLEDFELFSQYFGLLLKLGSRFLCINNLVFVIVDLLRERNVNIFKFLFELLEVRLELVLLFLF